MYVLLIEDCCAEYLRLKVYVVFRIRLFGRRGLICVMTSMLSGCKWQLTFFLGIVVVT